MSNIDLIELHLLQDRLNHKIGESLGYRVVKTYGSLYGVVFDPAGEELAGVKLNSDGSPGYWGNGSRWPNWAGNATDALNAAFKLGATTTDISHCERGFVVAFDNMSQTWIGNYWDDLALAVADALFRMTGGIAWDGWYK